MKYKIAVDWGGTKTIVALIQNNKILKKIKRMNNLKKNKILIVNQVVHDIKLVSEGLNKKDIQGVGIGIAGAIDLKKGLVINSPNIKFPKNFPLKKIIENKTKLKVFLENDANVAAFGEFLYYKTKNLVGLTLGTGVGGGIIIDGKIDHGLSSAGEIGHMKILDSGECSCGKIGCLESLVSSYGIPRIYKELTGKNKNVFEINILADQGNKAAIKTLKQAGYYLGIGISNVINIFDPELVVLSGSIANSKILVNEAKKIAYKNLVFRYKGKIIVSENIIENILLGAASLVK